MYDYLLEKSRVVFQAPGSHSCSSPCALCPQASFLVPLAVPRREEFPCFLSHVCRPVARRACQGKATHIPCKLVLMPLLPAVPSWGSGRVRLHQPQRQGPGADQLQGDEAHVQGAPIHLESFSFFSAGLLMSSLLFLFTCFLRGRSCARGWKLSALKRTRWRRFSGSCPPFCTRVTWSLPVTRLR
jgi:hypothetical protein